MTDWFSVGGIKELLISLTVEPHNINLYCIRKGRLPILLENENRIISELDVRDFDELRGVIPAGDFSAVFWHDWA